MVRLSGGMRIDKLWPELSGGAALFEVVVTVPRSDDGEPLVPRALHVD